MTDPRARPDLSATTPADQGWAPTLAQTEGSGWAPTRAQGMQNTQILGEDTDAAPPGERDVGRNVGAGQHELFVTCAPAEALLQQFEHLDPQYIAIHDLGCSISRRLLAGVAQASGRSLQSLTIRRQGYGTALATIEFIEWTSPDCRTIRLYTTTIDADGASRHAIAQALLAHSRLGVLIVGDLPAHAIASGLQPLHQALRFQHWPNRELLLLPLSSSAVLASQAAHLGQGLPVNVVTTPTVARPADAWSYISGAWNRLREQAGLESLRLPVLPGISAAAAAAGQTAAPPAPTAPSRPAAPGFGPLPMRPMPEVSRHGPREYTLEQTLNDYVTRLMKLNGMMGVCVFDRSTAQALTHAGKLLAPTAMAARGHALVQACIETGQAMSMPIAGPEAAVTLGAHHLVLHPLPRHPALMLLAILDKSIANLVLARLQIQRLDEDFST